jgi:hypothetical protein
MVRFLVKLVEGKAIRPDVLFWAKTGKWSANYHFQAAKMIDGKLYFTFRGEISTEGLKVKIRQNILDSQAGQGRPGASTAHLFRGIVWPFSAVNSPISLQSHFP